jgi:hypothetical protein
MTSGKRMTKSVKIAEGKSVSDFLFTIHTDTKKEECEIIEGFLQRLQYSKYDIKEQERPDFIATIDSIKVGIEITKYYSDFSKKGSKMQKHFIDWKNFALSLKQKIESTNKEFTNVYAALHFKNVKFDFTLLLSNDYYAELIDCLNKSKILGYKNSTVEISEKEFPLLSKFINHIYFESKLDSNNFLWWDARLQSGVVMSDEKSIENIISKKEKASEGYCKDFDQKWLIIFAAGLGLADIYTEFDNYSQRQGTVFIMSFENNEYKHKSKSVSITSDYFTHIYIWDKFHEKIFQIAPYYKKIFDYGETTIWVNHLPIKRNEE